MVWMLSPVFWAKKDEYRNEYFCKMDKEHPFCSYNCMGLAPIPSSKCSKEHRMFESDYNIKKKDIVNQFTRLSDMARGKIFNGAIKDKNSRKVARPTYMNDLVS